MKRKILTVLGVFVLFDLVFVVAVFFMLPTDEIARFIEKNIEKAMKQEQTVKIESLSISPLMTATVEKFSMEPRNVEPIDESLVMEGGTFSGFYCAPYVEPQPIIIDEIFINPDVIASLGKKFGGSFELKIQQGKVTGNVATKGNLMEIKANGETISLNDFALFSNMSGMQIYGDLGFTLRAILNTGLNAKTKPEAEKTDEDPAKTAEIAEENTEGGDKKRRSNRKNRPNRPNKKTQSGGDEKSLLTEAHIDLNTSMTALCPKRLKLGNIPLDLPFTVFGNIEASLEIKDNKLIIHKLTSDGPDIRLDITGDVMLKSKTNASPRLNIHAVILPSESWVTENDMKVIYQMCEKHPDGSIELDLKGSVKRLKHECGTPIPEPVAETPKDSKETESKDDKATKSKDTKNENSPKAKDDKTDKPRKNSPKKDNADGAPQNSDASDESKVVRDEAFENSVMRVQESRSGRRARPEGGVRRERSNVPAPSDFRTRHTRVNQDMERVQDLAGQDVKRYGRGRENMPNRPNRPMRALNSEAAGE